MNTSLATLNAQGRELALPAALTLNGDLLTLEQCLRLLPGKRIVARANWQGQTVLAKVFFKQKNWQDELAGYQRLHQTNLPTPAQLFSSPLDNGGVVLYQFIEHAAPLDQLWPAFDDTEKTQALIHIQHALQQLQQQNLLQADLHLGNFFRVENTLWVIDPASVQSQTHAQAFQQNQALFIAQLPLADRALALQCLRPDRATQDAVDALWQQRQRQFLKKIMRDCTDVASGQAGSVQYLCRRDYQGELAALLENPTQLLSKARLPLLKDGNSAKVFIIDTAIGPLVVKQYINKDWLRTLRRTLQVSRAKRSWKFAHAMQFANLNVPEPIAVIESKTGPFTNQSWFISREQSGSDLLSLWQQQAPSAALLQQVAQLARALQHSRISHGDMKATNFIVDAQQQLFVIDYDGCREHSKPSSLRQALAKDWRRFRANWPDNTALQRQLDNYLP